MNIKQVDLKYAAKFLETDTSGKLIDVRTIAEWQDMMIPLKNKRQLLLLSWRILPSMVINLQFADSLAPVVTDKTQALFFICKSGQRSQEAAELIASLGYNSCYNVLDGLKSVDSLY